MSYWSEYELNCECNQKVKETIGRKISEAKKVEYEQNKRLEQFQKGIKEGAIITISKMIYKMSIYSTSKAHECSRNITVEQIQNDLDQQTSKIPELSNFYANHRIEVLQHEESFDVQKELRSLTKKKEGAAGRLEKRKNDELEVIKKSLEKLVDLEKSLAIWKEGTRKEGQVNSIMITDMHA
jgi:hypothetical protein